MSTPADVIHDEAETTAIESDSDGGEQPIAESSLQAASSASKKKKKKRSKAAKALTALTSGQLPQAVVDQAAQTDATDDAEEKDIRKLFDAMNFGDPTAGIKGKDISGHRFWGTQPVPSYDDAPPLADGYIEPWQPRDKVRQDPYSLPPDFEWVTVDIDDDDELTELYQLLDSHYVEDSDASFRFKYSAEFLRWAVAPPGYHRDWNIGVRVSSSKKLVAFISGVPMTLRVRSNTIQMSEVNYICVHKKLRGKRLAPVLIKEVTRRIHLEGIFQAIYTAGVVIPTPVAICRYYHRPLNIPKLVDVRFSFVPRNMTLARMIRIHALPSFPTLKIREIENKDIEQVAQLFAKYMLRFDMTPVWKSLDEVRHQFMSGMGTGKMGQGGALPGRRRGQVTWTYVVEDESTFKITDFFSFYSLPSTVIQHHDHDPNHDNTHQVVDAAYLYYYATDSAFAGGTKEEASTKRLKALIENALIIANNAKFDVFNALTVMDSVPVLEELKFGPGSGNLNYYLYNWRTKALAGEEAAGGTPAGRGDGVVML